jgi:hypothetical protein
MLYTIEFPDDIDQLGLEHFCKWVEDLEAKFNMKVEYVFAGSTIFVARVPWNMWSRLEGIQVFFRSFLVGGENLLRGV